MSLHILVQSHVGVRGVKVPSSEGEQQRQTVKAFEGKGVALQSRFRTGGAVGKVADSLAETCRRR